MNASPDAPGQDRVVRRSWLANGLLGLAVGLIVAAGALIAGLDLDRIGAELPGSVRDEPASTAAVGGPSEHELKAQAPARATLRRSEMSAEPTRPSSDEELPQVAPAPATMPQQSDRAATAAPLRTARDTGERLDRAAPDAVRVAAADENGAAARAGEGVNPPAPGEHVDASPAGEDLAAATAGDNADAVPAGEVVEDLADVPATPEGAATSWDLAYALGHQAQEDGDLAAAADWYQKATELNPRHPAIHYDLGYALQLQGHTEEAIGQYRQAIELNPRHPHAYYNLGFLQQKNNDNESAVNNYNKAASIDPSNPYIYYNLALIMEDRGELVSARALYERVIALIPERRPGVDARQRLTALWSGPRHRRSPQNSHIGSGAQAG